MSLHPFNVGYELEFGYPSGSSAANTPPIRSFGYIKHDATVPDGFELESHVNDSSFFTNPEKAATFIPLFKAFNYLNVSTESELGAGHHVHLDKNVFTPAQILELNTFLIRFDVFTKTIGGRDFNYYCQAVLNTLEKIIHPYICTHDDKYRVLNVRPSNTIEYRFFKTTKDFNRFIANMQFCIATANFTLDDAFTKEDCESVKNQVLPSFCKYLQKHKNSYTMLLNFLQQNNLLCTKGAINPPKPNRYVLKIREMEEYIAEQFINLIPVLKQGNPNFPLVPALQFGMIIRRLNRFSQNGLINCLTKHLNGAVRAKAAFIEVEF